MSLDLYLRVPNDGRERAYGSGIFIRAGGEMFEITEAEWQRRNPGVEPVRVVQQGREDREYVDVWHRNITHNLNTMAKYAGLYDVLWRPDEHGIEYAYQAIEPAEVGLSVLEASPEEHKRFNPENGWGNYEQLVDFTRSFIVACKAFPNATIYACR